MEESLDDCLRRVLRKVLADSGSGSIPSAIHVSPNLHPQLADFQYGDLVKSADSVVFYADSTLPAAAAILGLHPSTLRARMHKLGILRPEIKESG